MPSLIPRSWFKAAGWTMSWIGETEKKWVSSASPTGQIPLLAPVTTSCRLSLQFDSQVGYSQPKSAVATVELHRFWNCWIYYEAEQETGPFKILQSTKLLAYLFWGNSPFNSHLHQSKDFSSNCWGRSPWKLKPLILPSHDVMSNKMKNCLLTVTQKDSMKSCARPTFFMFSATKPCFNLFFFFF